jgi:pyruvate formate-lyase activating enzyme-like uncharacterized protein
MVLFVTGVCSRGCWYCPISDARKGKDVAYANDRPVNSHQDILEEARVMSALGTSITGGEPLVILDRVVEYCALLKNEFGSDHHIHLYTSVPPGITQLDRLSGYVDEIRLHPPHHLWPAIMDTPYVTSARMAREMGFDIGIEVPSLSGIHHLIPALSEVDFLNINELEWSETNAEEMRQRGFDLEDSWHNAVKGARDNAESILKYEKVHWCSSTFKDSVQLRERLKRIAHNTARPFDEVTDDGTVVYGVVEPAGPIIGLEEGEYVRCNDHIELAWWVLLDEAENLPGKKFIVERYPNGGMIVEMTPL